MIYTDRPMIREDDKRLFDYLNVFKYLDMTFVKKHLYQGKSHSYIYTRMRQLEYYKYLTSIMLYEVNKLSNNTNNKKVIINSEYAHDFLEYNYHKTSSIKDFHSHYIEHQLLLANSLVYFYDLEETIDDESNVKVVKLLSEQELSVSEKTINVRPDAGIVIEINGNNFLFFVEVERSYAKVYDLSRKLIQQYSNINMYINKIEAFSEYDIQGCRIMFISSSRNKMNDIISKSKRIVKTDLKLLFTSIDDIESEMDYSSNIINLKYDTLEDKRVKLYEKITST